jgi:hypothetical protein
LIQLFLLFLLSALAASGVSAQAPGCAGGRANVRAFLQAVVSAGTLGELGEVGKSVASSASCERGWLALRDFEITSNRDAAEQSLRLLLRATRGKDAAWAYYGLGRLVMKAPWLNPGDVLVYVDAKSRAQYAATEALRRDSTLYEAGILLGDAVIWGQEPAEIRTARDRLRRYAGTSAFKHVTTQLIELDTWLRDADGLEQDAALGDSARAPRWVTERARVFAYAQRRDTAATLYLQRTLALADSAAFARLFADVQPIVSTIDSAAYSNLPAAARVEWFRTLWNQRASAAGVTPGYRIAEHYYRLMDARQRFGVPFRSGKGSGVQTAAVIKGAILRDFDDRGVILLRHGEPTRVISVSAPTLRTNESWVYDPPREGARLFTFAPMDGASGMRLLTDPFALPNWGEFGLTVQTAAEIINLPGDRLASAAQAGVFEDMSKWLHQHSEIDARYGHLAGLLDNVARAGERARQGMRSIAPQMMAIVGEQRGGLLDAVARESNIRMFAEDLPVAFDLLAFRGVGGTELTAALALPAAQILDSARFALRFSATLQWQGANGAVRRDSSMFVPLTRDLPAGAVISMQLLTLVPPGDSVPYWLTVETANGTRGRQIAGTRRIPDLSGSTLLVSDLVLAQPDRRGTWRRGAAQLALVPNGAFAADAPFTVFYEVYNLAAGEEFRTVLHIERIDPIVERLLRGRKTSLDVSFTTQATLDARTNAVQEQRKVETSLAPGRYRLRVTVSRRSGEQSAIAERILTIREPTR